MKKHKRVEYDEVVELGVHVINMVRTFQNVLAGRFMNLFSDNATDTLKVVYEGGIQTSGISYEENFYRFLLFVNHGSPYTVVRDPATPPKKLFKLRGKMRVASILALIELKANRILDPYLERWESLHVFADSIVKCQDGYFIGECDTEFPPDHYAKLYWEEV